MPDTYAVEVVSEPAVFRRNFTANVLDGALFAFGMSFVSLQTIIPVFVRQIGGGNIAVGLVPVLWIFGFNFPQILIARSVQRARHKKALLMKTAMGQRIPWLLLGVVAFIAVDRLPADWALLIFFVVFFLAAVGGSINLPVWFDLVAKLTPVNRRGRLFALRSVAAGLVGVLGGATAALVLDLVDYPANYALLFLLAFLAMMVSFYFLSRLVEGDAGTNAPSVPPEQLLRSVRQIVTSRTNFRWFLVADALLIVGTTGAAFYAVYAIEKFNLPTSYAGTFTAVMMATTVIGSLAFGWLGDRKGHKLNMLLSALMTGLGCGFALISGSVVVYYAVFVCAAAASSLSQISRLSFIAELCTAQERPTYIALTNLITSPFALAGIGGGGVANAFGFPVLFAASGGLALAAAAVWLFAVQEPRRHIALTS